MTKQIITASPFDFPAVMQLITNYKKHMKTSGIFQWVGNYPYPEMIQKVDNEKLYLLKWNKEIAATITLNKKQEKV